MEQVSVDGTKKQPGDRQDYPIELVYYYSYDSK